MCECILCERVYYVPECTVQCVCVLLCESVSMCLIRIDVQCVCVYYVCEYVPERVQCVCVYYVCEYV